MSFFYRYLTIKIVVVAVPSSPFGLLIQSGLATSYRLFSNRPVFNVRLLRTTFPISFCTRSKNLLFSLPLFLFPANSISIIFLPTYSWSAIRSTFLYFLMPVPSLDKGEGCGRKGIRRKTFC